MNGSPHAGGLSRYWKRVRPRRGGSGAGAFPGKGNPGKMILPGTGRGTTEGGGGGSPHEATPRSAESPLRQPAAATSPYRGGRLTR